MVNYTLDDPFYSMAARDGCCIALVWYSGIDAIFVQVGDPKIQSHHKSSKQFIWSIAGWDSGLCSG